MVAPTSDKVSLLRIQTFIPAGVEQETHIWGEGTSRYGTYSHWGKWKTVWCLSVPSPHSPRWVVSYSSKWKEDGMVSSLFSSTLPSEQGKSLDRWTYWAAVVLVYCCIYWKWVILIFIIRPTMVLFSSTWKLSNDKPIWILLHLSYFKLLSYKWEDAFITVVSS